MKNHCFHNGFVSGAAKYLYNFAATIDADCKLKSNDTTINSVHIGNSVVQLYVPLPALIRKLY